MNFFTKIKVVGSFSCPTTFYKKKKLQNLAKQNGYFYNLIASSSLEVWNLSRKKGSKKPILNLFVKSFEVFLGNEALELLAASGTSKLLGIDRAVKADSFAARGALYLKVVLVCKLAILIAPIAIAVALEIVIVVAIAIAVAITIIIVTRGRRRSPRPPGS